MTATENFWRNDDIVQRYAELDWIFPEEVRILERFRAQLPNMRMLDLGVGGGRTTVHFAPLAREYVGVDYSPAMVDVCVDRFAGAGSAARFEVADARSMPQYADGQFDFVLFSYNGLDCLVGGRDERRQALSEIHRVLAPGGTFAFSSHNLAAFPDELSFTLRLRSAREKASSRGTVPVRMGAALLRTSVLRVLNARPRRLAAPDYALLYDHRLGLRPMRYAYVHPAAQLRELKAAGFSDACALTADGREHRERGDVSALRDEWVHFLGWK